MTQFDFRADTEESSRYPDTTTGEPVLSSGSAEKRTLREVATIDPRLEEVLGGKA